MKKELSLTMKSKPEKIRGAFDNAFKSQRPANLKTPNGYHYAIGDLYFKIENNVLYSYQLDKKMWVQIDGNVE